MIRRYAIVGLALFLSSLPVDALTLGDVRGLAIIGQPLDLSVQVRMDDDQDPSALCFEAEVFHGETRQNARQVRALAQATAAPDIALVRITSAAIVDEPIVSVNLHATCGQKTARHYVMLADFPDASALAAVPLVTPTAATVKTDVAAARPEAAVPAPERTRPHAPDGARPDVTVKHALRKASVPASRRKEAQSSARPRLKLDSADWQAVAPPTAVVEAPPPPAEALLALKKMQALEADLMALRASATKTQASLTDLQARLQKAQTDRFSREWVYGLTGALGLSLAGLILLWRRERRFRMESAKWWSGPHPTQAVGAAPSVNAVTSPSAPDAAAMEAAAAALREEAQWMELDRLDAKLPAKKALTVDLAHLLDYPHPNPNPPTAKAAAPMEIAELDFDFNNLHEPEGLPEAGEVSPKSPAPTAH